MARQTIYCVQPYWSDGRKLSQGLLRQFAHEAQALRAGQSAARQVGGAIVYCVAGDPEFEDWDRPRSIAVFGAVPELVF